MLKLLLFKRLVVATLCVSLAACGGGGGGGSSTPVAFGSSKPVEDSATGVMIQDGAKAPDLVEDTTKAPGFTDGVKTPTNVDTAQVPATDPKSPENAGGFGGTNPEIKPPTGTGNPPMVGQISASQAPRQSGNSEQYRPGIDALENTPVPEDKLAKPERRTMALAKAGDPITRAQGETLPVAPVPTGMTAAAATQGHWSSVYNWPLIPIHLGMMPDGRLMSFGTNEGGRQTGKTVYAMFDPSLGLLNGHTVFNKNTLADIFCSAQLFLPVTNQFLTIGGDNLGPDGFTTNTGNNSSTIFTPSTNTMVAGQNMALPRWYATTTTLANGTTYIQGGLNGEAYPEVRENNGTFRSLTGAPTSNLDYWYPRNFLHPSGRIFGYDSYGNYYFVTTTGTGTRQIVNQWNVNYFGEAGSAAVFAPGRVLQLAAFTANASVIDFRTATPTMTPTAPMEQRRQNVSAVTLPDGKVLATGGSAVYNEIGPNAGNYFKASIWNPATGAWTIGATTPSGIARLYHSIAMLQPDGTVLVGGGGAWGPLSNNNVEFYYPPYLFNADGSWATKPKITEAPSTMNIGQTIQFTVDDAGAPITRITMTKTPATTHSLNMDQSFNELSFTRAGNVITAQLPTEIAWATPGYYMIFALTAKGTPSQARMVRMNVPNSDTAAPTNLTGAANAGGVTLNWTQSTTAGLKSNIISRAPTAAGPWTDVADVSPRVTYTDPNTTNGTYYYAVKATGPTSNPSPNSNVVAVTIGGGGGPVDPPPQTAPSAPTGVSAAYAQATGVTVSWANPAATSTMPAVTSNTILRGTAAAGPFTALATIPTNTTYVDALQTAGTYYYQVRAMNSVGVSPATTSNAVTIAAQGGTVAVPATGLSGYTCGAGCWTTDTGVRFAWTPSTTATKTNQLVERAPALAGPWTVVAPTLAVTVGTYVDKNVVSGTTYYYRVRADVGSTPGQYATLGYGITSNITLGGDPGTPSTPTAAIPAVTGATAGSPITMNSTGSAPGGTATSITAYQWTITGAGAGATIAGATNQSTATVNTTTAGSFTISLQVTNNQGGTATASRTVTVAAAPVGGAFGISSQGETRYLVMNWWRGDPAQEGDFRQPGICTGTTTSGGNCYLGARKTFRPIAFNIATTPTAVAGLIVMDVPQYENGVKSYDHYRLPVRMTKTGCTFKVSHVRTNGSLEFPLNPPGLEILDHTFTMNQALCDSFPTGAMTQAWLNQLNTQLTAYLGAKPAYNPIPYPYSDPRTGKDPSQP